MNIDYPPEAEVYRVRLRSLLRELLPPDWAGLGGLTAEHDAEFRRSWRQMLFEHGLLAPSWPEEFGGGGLTAVEQVVLAEELALARAPSGFENDILGINLLGNTILTFGTEEQKRHFLPRILSGVDVWCQGYSEPEAGSDLSSVRTRARIVGDKWLVDGQKTWTSSGQHANWIFVLARTDSSVAKQRGLSFLLVPMKQPGVEVRPIVNAAGYEGFCEVFFESAETGAGNILGSPGEGWAIANGLLGFERGIRVTTDAVRYSGEIDLLVELARDRGVLEDHRVRGRLAWCRERVELMRLRGYRALTSFLGGAKPGVDGAIHKVVWSEFFQAYTDLAMEILGADIVAPTGSGNGAVLVVPEAGTPNSSRRWVDEYLYARMATVYGGASQIQKNIIGERLLGLPREPRLDEGPFSTLVAGDRGSITANKEA